VKYLFKARPIKLAQGQDVRFEGKQTNCPAQTCVADILHSLYWLSKYHCAA